MTEVIATMTTATVISSITPIKNVIKREKKMKKILKISPETDSEPSLNVEEKKEKKEKKTIIKLSGLQKYFSETDNSIEIGVDEAGRGPMLGRVYTAAVVLPKDDSFNHSLMKDSKKFHSVKKIREAAEYIKKNALYWHVAYADEHTIDEINIRNATHKAMHESIRSVITKCQNANAIAIAIATTAPAYHLLIDGNDFKPLMVVKEDMALEQVPHTCIEGGDNVYTAIAAASILAKVERDMYIEALCESEPALNERYGLLSNKGYGTKIHMDGIQKYGISKYHRKSFGVCKNYTHF